MARRLNPGLKIRAGSSSAGSACNLSAAPDHGPVQTQDPVMQAAMLKSFGTPLVADDVPDPEIGTGEMIDYVIATPVPSYANEVFSGERRYPLPTPVVPGCPDPSPTGPFINLNVSLGLAAIVLTASIAAAL